MLLPGGYLRTRGSDIVDGQGNRALLAGVNWYGFDCASMVAGGLDRQPLDAICDLIVELGFNVVRLPFCVQMVLENPVIDRYLEANPSIVGKRALEIMDTVIGALGQRRVKVILDSHRGPAGWSTQENGLWYTRQYREPAWLSSWEQLAKRYATDSTVIGCDLHNEPGSPPLDESVWPRNGGATWGYGDPFFGNRRDWAAAATRAGNRILAINPNLLILVEGVRHDPAGPALNHNLYWPGGNLIGVRVASPPRRCPVPVSLNVPNRLVYSVHDYGPNMYSGQPWTLAGSTAETPDASNQVWDELWGFLAEENIAPVLVGEFGTPNGHRPGDSSPPEFYTDRNPRNPQGSWFTYLIQYIADHHLHWTYWCLNGTQSEAPGRNSSHPDWYGVLDPTWTRVASEPLMAKLRSI